MTTFLFILFWLGSGAIAYKIHEYWWTDRLDWTGREALFASVMCVIFGPFHILISVSLLFFSWLGERKFNQKVLKKARSKY